MQCLTHTRENTRNNDGVYERVDNRILHIAYTHEKNQLSCLGKFGTKTLCNTSIDLEMA